MIFRRGLSRKRRKRKLWEYLHTVALIVTTGADAFVYMPQTALAVGHKQTINFRFESKPRSQQE